MHFSSPINPSTLNANTVELEALGVTGNNAPGTLISLAGKISYNSATYTLIISLGASGLTLKTDAYQLILIGSGSQVISSPQGIALDGENLSNGNDPATGVQLPLPSGNGLPGGNFYDNFIINTTAPIISTGTFMLGASSDTNNGDDRHQGHTAQLRGLDHRAQLGACAAGGSDRDPGHRHRRRELYRARPFTTPTHRTSRPTCCPSPDDAGTALTDATGNFTVTVGVDARGNRSGYQYQPAADLALQRRHQRHSRRRTIRCPAP